MAGEKKGSPEQTTEADFKHKPIDRLLDVGPGFPNEVRGRFAALAKVFEPYEDLAATFGTGEIEDKLALVEILEQNGVVSEAVLHDIEAVGRLLNALNVNAEQKRRGSTLPNAQKEYEKQLREINRATASVHTRLVSDRRPLAASIMNESLHLSFLFSLERCLSEGGARGLKTLRDRYFGTSVMSDVERSHGQKYLGWLLHANAGSKLQETAEFQEGPGEFTIEERYQLLRNAQFLPMDAVSFNLPLSADGVPVTLTLQIHEKTNAFTLANFRIDAGSNQHTGSLSRVTGQLHTAGSMFMSLEEVFRFAEAKKYYARLRSMIIRALFMAWESGMLAERTYVTLESKDVEGIQTESEEIVVAPENKDILKSNEVGVKALEINDSDAREGEYSEKRRQFSTRRISWRRAMAAMKRCGVEIDVSHAHPKLRYGDKAASYLNSHDKDTQHNLRVLRETLKKLDIPFAVFMEKLY